MGRGWRRAFCTSSVRREELEDREEDTQRTPSPRINLFSGKSVSYPNTPSLQCHSPSEDALVTPTPALRCRTARSSTVGIGGPGVGSSSSNSNSSNSRTTHVVTSSPQTTVIKQQRFQSPCSPSRFSLLKKSLSLNKVLFRRCRRSYIFFSVFCNLGL